MKKMKEQTEIKWRDYRIVIDEWNWALSTIHEVEKGANKGDEYFKERGYFSSAERLILHIAKLETIKQKENYELQEFLEAYKEMVETVTVHVPVA
jgi:hypothetical protein